MGIEWKAKPHRNGVLNEYLCRKVNS